MRPNEIRADDFNGGYTKAPPQTRTLADQAPVPIRVSSDPQYTIQAGELSHIYIGTIPGQYQLPPAIGSQRRYTVKATVKVLVLDAGYNALIDGKRFQNIWPNSSIELVDYAFGKWGIV